MIQEVKQKIILKNGEVLWTGDIVQIITEETEKGIQSWPFSKISKEYIGKITDADEFNIKLDTSEKYNGNKISIPSYEIVSIKLIGEK